MDFSNKVCVYFTCLLDSFLISHTSYDTWISKHNQLDSSNTWHIGGCFEEFLWHTIARVLGRAAESGAAVLNHTAVVVVVVDRPEPANTASTKSRSFVTEIITALFLIKNPKLWVYLHAMPLWTSGRGLHLRGMVLLPLVWTSILEGGRPS